MRVLVLAGAALTACLVPAPAGAKAPPHTAIIVIDKLAFGTLPAKLRVGDTVVWVNRDIFRHSATATGHFDVDLPPHAQRRMLLTKAGSFAFNCKYHPGMRGVLQVGQ